jgi:hypothetical protein
MADRSTRAEQLRWLLEPPGKGDVRVVLELGDDARLSPGAQQALEQLMKELYETEVQGYAYQGAVNTMMLGGTTFGRPLQGCNLQCDRLNCGALVVKRT